MHFIMFFYSKKSQITDSIQMQKHFPAYWSGLKIEATARAPGSFLSNAVKANECLDVG